MSSALPAVAGGLGIYNALAGPGEMPSYAPPGYSSPEGTQVFDPATNSYVWVPAVNAPEVRQSQIADLYREKLFGGGVPAWQQNVAGQIADLEGQISGAYTGGLPTPPSGGGIPSSSELRRLEEETGQYTAALQGGTLATPEQVAAWQQELDALRGLDTQTDPFGDIGTAFRPGAEEASRIGELSGTFRDIAREGAEELYGTQLAGLAQRGITGGTAEFELGESQAQTMVDIDRQALDYSNALKNMNYQQKMQVLAALEQGIGAQAAQEMQGQGMAQNFALGQASLSQQQAMWDWQQQQAQQAQMQNSLLALGQALGYQFPGQQGTELTRRRDGGEYGGYGY